MGVKMTAGGGRRGACAAVLAVAGLALSGCTQAAESDVVHAEPAKVQAAQGDTLGSVTLEARAVERIGVETATVREGEVAHGDAAPVRGTVVPYSAVLYDAKGATFVYTNPSGRMYVREPVTVAFIEGDLAMLSKGPRADVSVVTVGAAELFGAELGVDH